MKSYFSREEKEGWNVGMETEVSRRQSYRILKAVVESFQVIFKNYLLYTFLYYWDFCTK